MKCVFFALIAVAAAAGSPEAWANANGARVTTHVDELHNNTAFYTYLGDVLPETGSVGWVQSYAVEAAQWQTSDRPTDAFIVDGQTYNNGVSAKGSMVCSAAKVAEHMAGGNVCQESEKTVYDGAIEIDYHVGNRYIEFDFWFGAQDTTSCNNFDVEVIGTNFRTGAKTSLYTGSYTGGAATPSGIMSTTGLSTLTIKSSVSNGCEIVIVDARLLEDPEVDCVEVSKETLSAGSVGGTNMETHPSWYSQHGFHINDQRYTSGVFAEGRDSILVYEPADLHHDYTKVSGKVGQDSTSECTAAVSYEVEVTGTGINAVPVVTPVPASGEFEIDIPNNLQRLRLLTKGGSDACTKTAWVDVHYCTAPATSAVNCVWSDYSPTWESDGGYPDGASGTCSAECGSGVQEKFRTHEVIARRGGTPCAGKNFKFQRCNANKCRIDCTVSDWKTAIACTNSCGGGFKEEFRSILVPAMNGGTCDYALRQNSTCDNDGTTDGITDCPVDCQVGEWGDWKTSSDETVNDFSQNGDHSLDGSVYLSCRDDDTELTRVRSITTNPDFGGKTCPPTTQQRAVHSARCPINCVANDWTSVDITGVAIFTDVTNAGRTCTAACGGGVQKLTRTVVAPQFGGLNCPVTEKIEPCNTQVCPVDCILSDWTDWGASSFNDGSHNNGGAGTCSTTCGIGHQYQHRTILRHHNTIGQCLECDTNGDGTIDDTELNACLTGERQCPNPLPCPGDCVVTRWGSWSLCDATCGNNNQAVRARSVHTDAINGGKSCPHLEETKACANTHECPRDCQMEPWGEFGVCSHTCGAATQDRTRHRIFPKASCDTSEEAAAATAAGETLAVWKAKFCDQHGGIQCPTTEDETRSCGKDHTSDPNGLYEEENCPIDCLVTDWVTDGACSAACNDGVAPYKTQVRTVTTNTLWGGRPCPPLVQHIPSDCNQNCCPKDCTVGDWSAFNSCGATCISAGEIVQHTRVRFVIEQATSGDCPGTCNDVLTDSEICALPACEVDCDMGDWKVWEGCSATCGAGTETRRRDIATHPSAHGIACPAEEESRTCVGNACVVNCLYSEWTTAACSQICGGGVARQTRSVLSYGTNDDCTDTERDGDACNTQDCPVDCGYDAEEAENWSDCSATCGEGFTHRIRVVIEAQHGGKSGCASIGTITTCNVGACPVDCVLSPWGEWGESDRTCYASGETAPIQSRERTIRRDSVPVGQCSAPLLETRATPGLMECPRACAYGAWSDWTASGTGTTGDSTCDVNCGGDARMSTGQQTRTRSKAVASDTTCVASDTTETQACNHHECPIVCQFGAWSHWGQCENAERVTRNCYTAGNTQLRSRRIIQQGDAANSCNAADTTQTQLCKDVEPCDSKCDDMGDWNDWEGCTGGCGNGQKSRTRTANNGAQNCILTDTEPCIAACDCTFTNWQDDTRGCFHTDQWNHYQHTTCSYADVSMGVSSKTMVRVITQAPNAQGLSCQAALGKAPSTTKFYIGAVVDSKLETCTGLGACQVDCEYTTEWTDHGTCVLGSGNPCGSNDATITRRRTIKHMGSNGGIDCKSEAGSTIVAVGSTNYEQVVVACHKEETCDCELGDWVEFSPCSATCGQGATKLMRRPIIDEATNGGLGCGPTQEVISDCTGGVVCPESCVVSEWSAWGECSESCDGGVMTKTRDIITPGNQNDCPTGIDITKTRNCNTHACNGAVVTPTKQPTALTPTPFPTKALETSPPTPRPTTATAPAPEDAPVAGTCDAGQFDGVSAVATGFVGRGAGDNFCNLCKCYAGGRVGCQMKRCNTDYKHTGANYDAQERDGKQYQECSATTCHFEYMDGTNDITTPKFTIAHRAEVKFLKTMHSGLEANGDHHFCAFNLRVGRCECRCWNQ
jgi:hypothetical protein